MRYRIEQRMPVVLSLVATALVAAGLSLQPIAAAESAAPAGEQAAPATQEAVPAAAPAGGEAPVTDKAETPAPANGAASKAEPKAEPKTLEEIRAAMEAAEKRRAVLMKPDPSVAGSEAHQELLDKWGVEVYGVRLAARDYMIDFRFRVVDAEKALPLFDQRIKPYLLTEGTNIKLPVPVGEKVGAFRTTNRGKNITADRDYYLMFGNPDSYVNPGQKVTVVIGDFRAEHLTVQ